MTAPSAGAAAAHDITSLVEAYRPWLLRYIATRVRRGDGDLADDLTQVTFERAWQALPTARLESVEVERAWLCTIARHVIADHYRSRATQQRAREESTDPTEPGAWHDHAHGAIGDDTDRVCALVDLARSMAAADPEHRRLVALRLLDETPWSALAGMTRQGKATVRRMAAEATAGVIG